jgi:hypothetical protein
MSEIPMPEPGGYEAAEPKKKTGCCSRTVMCIGVIAIIVVGVIAAAVILPNILGPSNGEPEYGERDLIVDNDYDPDIYPTYYYDEFSVSSSETQTSTQPDLLFQVTVDKGSDTASVTVHIAVYDLDQSSFDSMTSGGLSGADEYILGSGDLTDEPVNHYIDLHNYADTYTWVLWFETSEKSDTWSCDITITLRYNWS